ncbi:hypothetical protein CspeluHIS016_0302690 [Cutaneotrichosporon spelunceum]|uniref:Uncharacterized protein n=1 Tax=Cutaneotrichosporon spelunceum TaxID=1672016 RepID=A0AAD3TTB9_9TREE|nr:hypothetical protein CspeluHIS016_0302690 [Cutaneotrichosporon spelunceum]
MGDDDVKPRLDGEPPSSNPQHSDASFLDAEYEEEPLPCLTDNDYDDDVDRPPLQATRPEPFRPSQDLAHNPRDVLRADYDHENRHYSKLHNLVMAFNPLRPLWPTGLPPAGEIAPPATFADRAPTAAELAALDMGPAVVAMAARADMMNILTEELKKVARLMLRFIKDALVEAGDGSTSDRPVVPTPPPHGRTAPAPPPIGIGSWLEDCSPKPAPFDTNRPSVLHPTSQGAAQRTQESPTWQLRCRTFPARTASSWCYFETSSSAPPEPLFPIQNTSRPLPRPTAGRAPPPVITHDMPRGTARNFVYGPPLYTETPEQFRGRLQVDLVTSEAAARLILARQAVEENDKQRQADRTSERAALGLGRPPSGLCNPKKDAAASNRFACTIDGAPTAGQARERSPVLCRAALTSSSAPRQATMALAGYDRFSPHLVCRPPAR